ncbi:DUF3618 domain-containing protein [Aeromicrobium sp. CF4.19]|uniref:DUF3618 domain-containing protein n=1 Tax=Aeromicrobium sp. CF4.19 TaxID=3373082 RepID=UPI003EE81D07
MNQRDDLQAARDESLEHLAETVDALGDKLDVKSRAQGTVADVKAAARNKAQDDNARRAAALLAIGAVAAVGVLLWRRRS